MKAMPPCDFLGPRRRHPGWLRIESYSVLPFARRASGPSPIRPSFTGNALKPRLSSGVHICLRYRLKRPGR